MSILEAILQGLLQGFTEFLPVSSSGHLSLFQHFFGLDNNSSVAVTIVMHLGSLVAVFIAFWDKIWALILEFFSMLKDIFTGKFKWKTMNGNRRMIIMIIISILPLFIFYIFKDLFESIASDSDITVEGIAFLYTSALLFISTKCKPGNKTTGTMLTKDAVFIGIYQGVALVPGISRSGSTISSGLLAGLKREDAVEYSFILGIPVILAGAAVELSDFSKSQFDTNIIIPLIAGFIAAAISGYIAIRLIKMLVIKDKFRIFAFYTFILGITVLGLGIYEHISGYRILLGNASIFFR
jgi:undecaprenyl-diphosphatase